MCADFHTLSVRTFVLSVVVFVNIFGEPIARAQVIGLDPNTAVARSFVPADVNAPADINDLGKLVPVVVAVDANDVNDANAVEAKPVVSAEDDASRYLNAVRAWADLVLEHGRDKYGPKHTPLFVDGLNVNTLEPVKWIAPNGDRWILSNLASQQNLFRTLDALTIITGDPKYKQAAMDAIKYAFENLRSPNGLLYWGHAAAYDAQADKVQGGLHCLKLDYPYYELMWDVDPNATKTFIEAYWSAHVLDWSNLDMNRLAQISKNIEEPWNHEYKGGPVFFKSRRGGLAHFSTGSSLINAGTMLFNLTGKQMPLLWSKRLAHRYIDTRHPNTGISAQMYNNAFSSIGSDLEEHFLDPYTTLFPQYPFEGRYLYYPDNPDVQPWICMFLIGEMLDKKGNEFTRWALEELIAWGKASYRREDNSFVPMLTDGTSIEGYVIKRDGYFGPKGAIAKPYFADLTFLWAYAVAYRITGDEYMWQMVRDIALGNRFGDMGETLSHKPKIRTDTNCSDVYGLLGFLELHRKTKRPEFLEMAQSIGNNIVGNYFHKGFFVSSKKHIYTRFDCFESLALLYLYSVVEPLSIDLPKVWPCMPLFKNPYRYKNSGIDRVIIYTLTESPEPVISLNEAATMGNLNLVKTLINEGVNVNNRENTGYTTPLHHAVISGHRDVVEFLLSHGADINARDSFIASALHYAVENNSKDIADLLVTAGADMSAKNGNGQTPLDIAVNRGFKDIAELLFNSGAKGSIHTAAQMGDLATIKTFLEDGTDVNVKDARNMNALHYAAREGHKEMVESLLANGAEINAGASYNRTAAQLAMESNHSDIVELLISKGADVSPLHLAIHMKDEAKARSLIEGGADVNKKTQYGTSPLLTAAGAGLNNIVELLLDKGANVNVRDNWDWTPLHEAVSKSKDMVELLIANGANVNAKDGDGNTPLWYASKEGHTEIVEILRKHGAKEDGEEEKKQESAPAPKEDKTADPNAVEINQPDAANPQCFAQNSPFFSDGTYRIFSAFPLYQTLSQVQAPVTDASSVFSFDYAQDGVFAIGGHVLYRRSPGAQPVSISILSIFPSGPLARVR